MNLNQIDPKNFIMALFKRDDGERFLLGMGLYEFKEDLQHFQPNIIANDIVEKQGANGQLLAGQVLRTGTQSFDGYVGDETVTRADTETARRNFMRFFQPNYFYTVIYIMPDGNAIQRQNGYLVDAPSIPEQYQRFPEYHVALAFENLNYYTYDEDASGNEIYAQVVELTPEGLLTGGLVWGATPGTTISQIKGDTSQSGAPTPSAPKTVKTVTGKQIVTIDGIDYSLNLGAVELCKLDTYQDYIWKDGGTWKIHKATGRFTFTTSLTTGLSKQNYGFVYNALGNPLTGYSAPLIGFCSHFVTDSGTTTWTGNGRTGMNSSGALWFQTTATPGGDSQTTAQFAQWLVDQSVTFYYKLATPTDTAITDATLLAQLNDIDGALSSTTTAPIITATDSGNLSATATTTTATSTNGVIWTGQGSKTKNILTVETYPSAQQGIMTTKIGDGGIHIKGTATTSYSNLTRRVPLYLPPGDYTFSIQTARARHTQLRVYFTTGDSQDVNISAGTTSRALHATNPIKEAYIYTATIADTSYDETIYPMLEVGDGTQGFEPYVPAGGAVWDAESGHSTTTFTIDSLFPVNPIWTVPGPAESPIIENVTNGTSLSYLGQIPAGQSLVIDCGAQTATLAGANVKNNVRGTWQTFDPGSVTIRYSGANVADTCTLKWNEVVE